MMPDCKDCRKVRNLTCPDSSQCYLLDDKPHFEPRLEKCVYYYEHYYYAMNPDNSCRIPFCANKKVNKAAGENHRILCNQLKQKEHGCYRVKPLSFFERLLKYKKVGK